MGVSGSQRPPARAASADAQAETAEGGAEAAHRQEILDLWLQARSDGLTAEAAAEAVGVSRRTLFRWQRRQAEGRLQPERRGPRIRS